MRNFETDYLISWDFNGKDCPCVTISVVYQDGKNGTKVVGEQIGTSYKKSGVVSLRQLIAEYEAKRNRNVGEEDYEKLRAFLKKKKEEIDEKGEENGNS